MELAIKLNDPSAAQLTGSKTDIEYQLFKKVSEPFRINMYRLQREASTDNSISSLREDSIKIYKGLILENLQQFIYRGSDGEPDEKLVEKLEEIFRH